MIQPTHAIIQSVFVMPRDRCTLVMKDKDAPKEDYVSFNLNAECYEHGEATVVGIFTKKD